MPSSLGGCIPNYTNHSSYSFRKSTTNKILEIGGRKPPGMEITQKSQSNKFLFGNSPTQQQQPVSYASIFLKSLPSDKSRPLALRNSFQVIKCQRNKTHTAVRCKYLMAISRRVWTGNDKTGSHAKFIAYTRKQGWATATEPLHVDKYLNSACKRHVNMMEKGKDGLVSDFIWVDNWNEDDGELNGL